MYNVEQTIGVDYFIKDKELKMDTSNRFNINDSHTFKDINGNLRQNI